MTAVAAGLVPNRLSFYQEDSPFASADDMGDSIAKIVMQRFRDARQSKVNFRPYQDKSVVTLLDEADRAMEKRYTPTQAETLIKAFGFCPTRFYGLSATKTLEIANWKSELVAGDPGGLVNIAPTPWPRLSDAAIVKIKQEIKRDLMERMTSAGIGDPSQLLSARNGRLHPLVKEFLDNKSKELRQIEQSRIIAAAAQAATEARVAMRDVVVEGDFREAYAAFSTSQIKYGVAFMRFPHMKRRIIISSANDGKGALNRKWKTVPTFSSVSPWNMFPTNDGPTLQECTAVMEYREINKMTLVGLARDNRYDQDAIIDILETYSLRSRTWLFPEAAQVESANGQAATYWGPEELVGVVHHEGVVSGRDLQDFGLTGYEAWQLYSVRAEICCGRTIRLEVKNPLTELPSSYAGSKFDDLGPGVWNAIGVPGILHDTEERLQTLLHLWENNVDWALRPPLQTNPEALKNPAEAKSIVPGGQYEISDMIGPGVSPDPIRAIRGPSAQYQILYPLITAVIRQADHEVGVPSLSDMATFGRGSLGELSARVSQAVRRVRTAAYTEDRAMKPIWHVLWQYTLEDRPELQENADLDFDYVGIVGLLQAEQARKVKMEVLSLARGAVTDQVAGPDMLTYAYNDVLKDLGVPTQMLGMGDPLIDNAMAIALKVGGPPVGTGMSMVPQLDGRSGSISSVPTAIAAPNGGTAGPAAPPMAPP
jgi:hypothetical protein